MNHVVAAPDKFAGTATARQIASAVARAARRQEWTVDEVPMADGGEGLLDAVGGEPRVTTVSGPLGDPVDAEWRWLADPCASHSQMGELGAVRGGSPDPWPTAVIEMARAAGRDLMGTPSGDQPMRASTRGVGQLIASAIEEGARRVVVGCGGSATTDGGLGAVDAIGRRLDGSGVVVIVASDVTIRFLEAARVFGPQKGADPGQVEQLSARLRALARRYRALSGIDVDALVGSGAAGGLAGGLAALGARIVPGFDLVADLVGLRAHLRNADVVMTGEGRLDLSSLAGKVVGGVLARARDPEVASRQPSVLCVVGEADPVVVRRLVPSVHVVALADQYGPTQAREHASSLVEQVVGSYLEAWDRGG